MQPTHRPRVKICCISSPQEAQLAIHYGASALGLISGMPSGPGVISEDLIARQQDATSIIAQQRYAITNVSQPD